MISRKEANMHVSLSGETSERGRVAEYPHHGSKHSKSEMNTCAHLIQLQNQNILSLTKALIKAEKLSQI